MLSEERVSRERGVYTRPLPNTHPSENSENSPYVHPSENSENTHPSENLLHTPFGEPAERHCCTACGEPLSWVMRYLEWHSEGGVSCAVDPVGHRIG